MAVVLDTGPIYSSIDRSDPDHALIAELLRTTPRPHLVVEPALVEVDYWLRKLLDTSALDAFLRDVVDGRYELVGLEADDLTRTSELERRYEDSDLGFVDAAIVAVSERLDVGSVVTFDRRIFTVVRPSHRPHFELLP